MLITAFLPLVASVYWQIFSNEMACKIAAASGGRARYETIVYRYSDIWESPADLFDLPIFPIVTKVFDFRIGEKPTDETFSCLSRLNGLESLECDYLEVTDENLKNIPPQQNLRWMDFSDCHFLTAAGISFAAASPLVKINLSYTQCGRGVANALRKCRLVEEINLRGTKVDEKEIKKLFKNIVTCFRLNIADTPCRGRDINDAISGKVKSLQIDSEQLRDLVATGSKLVGVQYLLVWAPEPADMKSVAWMTFVHESALKLETEFVYVGYIDVGYGLVKDELDRLRKSQH